ncbi:3515_t:CDS:2 [Entrophospora sp. SA101]|nr:3515_t:CDS:2 [Entrophospora sp. SA101]
MTEVSRWASESWGSENDEIKEEFKEFAKKVASIYRQKVKEALTTRVAITFEWKDSLNYSVVESTLENPCKAKVDCKYPLI